MISLETKIAAAKGRPLGFDYLRLALALGVILVHSVGINYNWKTLAAEITPVQRMPWGYIVPMFFALSGFLVAGSLERSKSLPGFLGLRGLRIVPALAMEITLSALILGPLFTTFSLSDYFSHPDFRKYFLNVVGLIQLFLPGVFANHPWPFMNSQLWTVPIELDCYLVLAVLALVRVTRHKWLLLAAVALLQLAVSVHSAISPPVGTWGVYHSRSLVMCFLWGLALYHFRDKAPWSLPLFLASTAAMLVLLAMPWGEYMFALPAAYMAAYLGVTNPPRNKVLLSGDYSYGLYLYGFPIQQAVYAFGPWTHSWYANFLLTVPLAAVFAVFSWRCVERPALSLRKLFSRRPSAPGPAGDGPDAIAAPVAASSG